MSSNLSPSAATVGCKPAHENFHWLNQGALQASAWFYLWVKHISNIQLTVFPFDSRKAMEIDGPWFPDISLDPFLLIRQPRGPWNGHRSLLSTWIWFPSTALPPWALWASLARDARTRQLCVLVGRGVSELRSLRFAKFRGMLLLLLLHFFRSRVRGCFAVLFVDDLINCLYH